MEGERTLRGVSCTRQHDHCDLTCTFSLLRREGHNDLTELKQRVAEITAAQALSSFQINQTQHQQRKVLSALMTQGFFH